MRSSYLTSLLYGIAVIALNFPSALAFDLTLIEASAGEAVVDACVQKLEAIRGIFSNDYGFVKRIALVESNFGTNATAVFANPTGGIWQISQAMYDLLAANARAISISQDSAFTIGRENTDLTQYSFSVPMRSAFAARLFIDVIVGRNNPIPTTLAGQARWWATHYNTNGNADNFIRVVEEFERINTCQVRKLDLWFLLDGSGSIGTDNFQLSLNFVEQTAASFQISPDEVRTGLMIYGSDPSLISRFNEHTSNDAFTSAIRSAAYPGTGTETGEAIRAVNAQGFNVASGARPRSEAVPRILVVLTDGQSGDDVKVPSDEIKDAGVIVYAVGVGRGYNQEQINTIATDASYAFEIARFSELVSVLQNSIQEQSCRVPVVVADEAKVGLNVPPGEVQYSQVDFPENGSVELSFEVSDDNVGGMVYLSSLVPNPGPVIHDIAFALTEGTIDLVVNDGDDDFFGLGLSSITRSSKSRRRKRFADNNPKMKTLFIAIFAPENGTLSLNLTSVGNTSPANITTTPAFTTTEPTTTPKPTTTPQPTTAPTPATTTLSPATTPKLIVKSSTMIAPKSEIPAETTVEAIIATATNQTVMMDIDETTKGGSNRNCASFLVVLLIQMIMMGSHLLAFC